MATGRGFSGNRLPLAAAFAVLLVAAFGAGCKGFFPGNTLNSIAIQPPSPQIQVGPTTTVTLQAWGTYSDNSRSQITSGVVWTSSDSTIAEILPPCDNTKPCGSATVEGLASGTATITASAQGLSTTASATTYLGNITGFQVCMGTFGNTTSCSNGSTHLAWDASGVAKSSVSQNFIAQANNPAPPPPLIDLTTASTWTVIGNPTVGSITCDSSVSPTVCTVDQNTTAGSYSITVTYGTSNTATVDVTVTE
jgi:hypothetical protein